MFQKKESGKAKINTKETYVLKFNEKERNFSFADCCRPIPGDEVMGFINDDGEVEVHALTCPRAQVLKASFGPRIVAHPLGQSGRTLPRKHKDRRH